jgi:hypothetical protein
MANQRATDKRKELWDAFDTQYFQRIESNKKFKFPDDDVNKLLDILLPQYLDSVVDTIKTALYQIDPTWQKGQFKVFSKHFRMNLVRSLFTQRLSLSNAKYSTFSEDKILEFILESSQGFSDAEKSAYYGVVLSEYILRCPQELFPHWTENFKDKPNFIVMWNLHSNIWLDIFK